jgi:hypothetical protein
VQSGRSRMQRILQPVLSSRPVSRRASAPRPNPAPTGPRGGVLVVGECQKLRPHPFPVSDYHGGRGGEARRIMAAGKTRRNYRRITSRLEDPDRGQTITEWRCIAETSAGFFGTYRNPRDGESYFYFGTYPPRGTEHRLKIVMEELAGKRRFVGWVKLE